MDDLVDDLEAAHIYIYTSRWYAHVLEDIRSGKPVVITHDSTFAQAPKFDGEDYQTVLKGAHASVAYGIYEKKGKEYLVIFDPWTGKISYWDESYIRGIFQWYSTVTIR